MSIKWRNKGLVYTNNNIMAINVIIRTTSFFPICILVFATAKENMIHMKPTIILQMTAKLKAFSNAFIYINSQLLFPQML